MTPWYVRKTGRGQEHMINLFILLIIKKIIQNWPKAQKNVVLLIIFVNTVVFFSVPAPMLASGTFAIAQLFGISTGKVSQLSGYQLLVVACWG